MLWPEVTVMYRTGLPIRDRWGAVLMHGGGALMGVFPNGEVSYVC